MGIVVGRILPGDQAVYNWITHTAQQAYNTGTHSYTSGADNDEDDDSEYTTTTTVVYGTPLRETKCLFVPEVLDYYTEEQLNTVYHTADEYRNALSRYGLVYKSQKFSNADTAQKLLEYALDWIKNNYHGGITNFTVSALDMHIMDPTFEKYTVGQRVSVQYTDPGDNTETSQVLTVITAEYDLNNPDKNSYKIGIPDVTLNKVYGETSKSGGGGGKGGKTSDETDNETNTEVDGLIDDAEADARHQMELLWSFWYKGNKNGDLELQFGDLETPGKKDPAGDFIYGLTADIMNASEVKGTALKATERVTSKYISATGGVDANKVSTNSLNGTEIHSETIESTKKVKGKDGEFETLKVGGKDVAGGDPATELPTVTVEIDGVEYELYGKEK